MPSFQPYIEKELLTRVARGDEEAYKQVFDAYWNKIYQVALSFLKTPDQAQDAVQQVFIKLWEKRNKLCPSALLKLQILLPSIKLFAV